MRTRFGLPLIVTGVVIAAIPLFYFAKFSGAASDVHASCSSQALLVGQAVNQLNFSKSASLNVRSGLQLSNERSQKYLATSTALEQQIFHLHAGLRGRERVETQLAQANALIMDQSGGLTRAQSLLSADDKSLSLGSTEITAASEALENGDCAMARRHVLKSGWPKETPYKDLSLAARLNVEASSGLDAALDLILAAQRTVRLYGGTVSTLR